MKRRTLLQATGALGAASMLGGISPSLSHAAEPTVAPRFRIHKSPTGLRPLDTESDDLTPYTGAWTDDLLMHLLRRSMFGVPPAQFQAAKALGSMNAVVTQLLACQDTAKVPVPDMGASWLQTIPPAGTGPDDPVTKNRTTLMAIERQQIENWWFDQIVQENLSIRQKMTMLWTNHFVTGSTTVIFPGYIYQYLQTCMANALGNFKSFALAISTDPAMLVYLNGDQNYVSGKKSYVNENYAREVMELFTLGIDFPNTNIANYTETDIQNSARALTGWAPTMTAPFVGQFTSAKHDATSKTFLGQTGNWALQDILNIIFQQPTTSPVSPAGVPAGTPQGYTSAYWVCQKLYKEFVYYVPNASVVDAMARLMLTSNFEIAPVMQALLSSAHFYDANVIGAQIKSPANYVGSLVREFGLTYPAFDPSEPPIKSTDPNTGYITYTDPNPTLSLLTAAILNVSQGQQLLNPPNVKGWPGGENWLSAGTFQGRENTSLLALNNSYDKGNYQLSFSVDGYAQQIPNYASLSAALLGKALEDASLAFTLGTLESGGLGADLQINYKDPNYHYDTAGMKLFAQALPQLPEFQLY